MARKVRDWSFTFSSGGRVNITATVDGIPDSDGSGDIIDGVTKRLAFHPNDFPDATAMGLAIRPAIEKLSPGTLTAKQKTDIVKGIVLLMWEFRESSVLDGPIAPI